MNRICAMTTSWDDGHPSDTRIADLLAKHGLSGTFYIPRAAPNVVMPDAEVRAIASGFEVGAHTLTHPRLTTLDDSRAREEIAGSKHWVEDVTSRRCEMFCPPEGKFIAAHREMARAADFRGLRTVELLSTDAPRGASGGAMVELPTSVQAHPHSRAAYARNALRRKSVAAMWSYARAGCPSDWTTLARRLLERVRTRGGAFHLWGHSWEIDVHEQWPALESILRTMREFATTVRPMTNGELARLALGPSAAIAAGDASSTVPSRG